jgi:hypothetical protein
MTDPLIEAVEALLRAIDALPLYPRTLAVSTALCEARDALHAYRKSRADEVNPHKAAWATRRRSQLTQPTVAAARAAYRGPLDLEEKNEHHDPDDPA